MRRWSPRKGKQTRVWTLFTWLGLLVVAGLVTGCGGCTEGSSDQPPTVVVSGAPSGPFVIGDTLRIQVQANDPEGGGLTFDWDHKPKSLDWTVDAAQFLTFANSATFEWGPLASDALNDEPIQLIFIVDDQAGNTTEKVITIEFVAGNGQPVFRANASELYDPRSGKALEFEVTVVDQDSEMVELEMDRAQSPGGATFKRSGPFSGRFSWTPTVDQLERRVHNVRFTANDGDNPEVEFKVTIVVRSATAVVVDKDQTDQMCPGEAVVAHTPLGPQRDPTAPYRFEAQLLDDNFDRIVLYVSTSHPYNGEPMSGDEEREGDSIEMTNEGGTWVAEVQPYTAFVPAGGSLTAYYQLCAFDDDASGLDSIACAPSSGELELWHSFTIYAPDAEDCVEDGLDQIAGNDSFETAAPISERWEPFRVCDGNEDFYSFSLREGESALFSAVYNDGADISFEAFDGSRAPIDLKQSECTGLVTAEVEAPQGSGEQTFFIKASGASTNYMLRAFKSGNAAECGDVANEPNDEKSNATPITADAPVSAEICPDGNDLDVYSIDLQAGDVITVTSSFSNADGNLDMTLFGPSDEISRGGLGTGAYTAGLEDVESFEYNVEESGTHYLLVFNNNETSNAYELDVSITQAPPCADSDEFTSAAPNHSQTDSALIPADDELTLSGLAVCPGKPDWYRRTEFDGALVLGEVSVTGGDGTIDDVTVQVFDEAMNVIGAGSQSAGVLDFDYTPAVTGPHYIKVESTTRVEYEIYLLR